MPFDSDMERWKEQLFQALCADNSKRVRILLKAHKTFHVDDLLFGIFYVNAANGTKKFISYGAHSENDRHCVRHGATALHVAVWKNAMKSARLLIFLGASTNKKDAIGVSAFDRAHSHEMSTVLKRPAAPRDLKVLSLKRGRAMLQWEASKSKPLIDLFELREDISGQVWEVDLENDIQVFALNDRRDGPVICLFETPPGSIISASSNKFSVRSRNMDGYWSLWCEQEAQTKSKHWIEEWTEDRLEDVTEKKAYSGNNNYSGSFRSDSFRFDGSEGKRGEWLESKYIDPRDESEDALEEKNMELILGSVSFGYVRVRDWIKRAQAEQSRAATRIQSIFRTKQQRKAFDEEITIRRRLQVCTEAARCIQRFYRHLVTAHAKKARERQLQQVQLILHRSESSATELAVGCSGGCSGHEARRSRCTFSKDRRRRVEREEAKYRALRAMGYPIQLPAPRK